MNIETKFKLNNGIEIPALGLGTYLANPGKEVYNAVISALEAGYRHIDTAAMYGNEADIGQAVKDSSIPREEIFITTKVWNSSQGYEKTFKAFTDSMKKLKTDYADLYLIHWPVPEKRANTWKALLKLYEEGDCKAVGISNYTIKHIEKLLDGSPVIPAANQVEFHPYLYQKELLEFCRKKEILVEAYSPLTRTKKFGDKRLIEISEKHGKTQAQILIRWPLQLGCAVLPKSANAARIRENADVFDFELDKSDMEILNNINEDYRVTWDPSQLD